MPPPAGIQPFEWAIICALFVALVSLVIYIWNDAKNRDAADKLSITKALENFSVRVDKSIEDARQRVHDHAQRLQVMGERIAVLESRREDARDEQHETRAELSRLNESVSKLSSTVAQIAGRMGITSSTSQARVPPIPRADR
jgi:peptidoglycan hydrolase CwlO-like protein